MAEIKSIMSLFATLCFCFEKSRKLQWTILYLRFFCSQRRAAFIFNVVASSRGMTQIYPCTSGSFVFAVPN